MQRLMYADRIQQHFNDLDMKADDEELHQYDQLYASFSGSSGSLSSDVTNGSISVLPNSVSGSVAGSITTVLSSAIANNLSLSSHDHDARQIPNCESVHVLHSDHSRRTRHGRARSDGMDEGYRTCRSNLDSELTKSNQGHLKPVDFGWLLERCEGDNQLVMEVLRTFCEQGQRHICGMQSSIKDVDAKMLLFHAVIDQNFS
jgi:hypothetical protein